MEHARISVEVKSSNFSKTELFFQLLTWLIHPVANVMFYFRCTKYLSNIYICLTVQCLNINLIPESGNVKAMVLRVMAEHGAVDGA